MLPIIGLLALSDLTLPREGTPCRETMAKVLQNQRAGPHKWSSQSDEQIRKQATSWFNDIKPALPPRDPSASTKTPVRIIDIGCGLGMYHVYMRQYFGSRSEHFLVDQSQYQIGRKGFERHSSVGGFHRLKEMPFYTSAECAKDIAMASEFDDTNWHWVNATADNVIAIGGGTADIVMSLLSWGFHYPVSAYAKAVHHVLKPTGRLILTLRHDVGKPTKASQQLDALREAGFACKVTPQPHRTTGPTLYVLVYCFSKVDS